MIPAAIFLAKMGILFTFTLCSPAHFALSSRKRKPISIQMDGLLSYAGMFLFSAILAWAVTHFVRIFALRFGIVAKRDGRRRHEKDTPLLGGTGIFVGVLVTTLALWWKPEWFGIQPFTDRFSGSASWMTAKS